MKYLVLFIFLSGCALDNSPYYEYLHRFNSDITRLGYRPIDFSETYIIETTELNSSLTSAQTQTSLQNSGLVVIKVSPKVKKLPKYMQQAIIYHELGHAFLGLEHEDLSTRYLMSGRGLNNFVRYVDMDCETNRLSLVREMLERSNYDRLF